MFTIYCVKVGYSDPGFVHGYFATRELAQEVLGTLSPDQPTDVEFDSDHDLQWCAWIQEIEVLDTRAAHDKQQEEIIRKRALTKLTDVEKRVLGLKG